MCSFNLFLFTLVSRVVHAHVVTSTPPTETTSKTTPSLNLALLPSCAQYSIFQDLEASSCSPSDAACICRDSRLMSDLDAGIEVNCNSADKLLASSIQSVICTPLPAITTMTTAPTTTPSSSSTTYTAIEAPTVTVTASASSTSSGAILTDHTPLITPVANGTTMTTKYNFTGTVSFGSAGPTTLSNNWPGTTVDAVGFYWAGFVVGMMSFMAFIFSEL